MQVSSAGMPAIYSRAGPAPSAETRKKHPKRQEEERNRNEPLQGSLVGRVGDPMTTARRSLLGRWSSAASQGMWTRTCH